MSPEYSGIWTQVLGVAFQCSTSWSTSSSLLQSYFFFRLVLPSSLTNSSKSWPATSGSSGSGRHRVTKLNSDSPEQLNMRLSRSVLPNLQESDRTSVLSVRRRLYLPTRGHRWLAWFESGRWSWCYKLSDEQSLVLLNKTYPADTKTIEKPTNLTKPNLMLSLNSITRGRCPLEPPLLPGRPKKYHQKWLG